MIIETSSRSAASGNRPRVKASAEQPAERFPHDLYQTSLDQPETSWRERGRASAQGALDGMYYLGSTGGVLGLFGSVLTIGDSSINPGLVLLATTALGVGLGAIGGALVGCLTPGAERAEAAKRHEEIAQIVSAGEVTAEQSPTAALWQQVDAEKSFSELTTSEQEAVRSIVSQMKSRGFHVSGEANASEGHQLHIDGEPIDSLDELKLFDATTGGGLVILDLEQREVVELMAGMSHRGFDLGRYYPDKLLTHNFKIPTMASKVFENGFESGSNRLEPPVEVRHKTGAFTAHTLSALRELDDAVRRKENSALTATP